MRCTIISAVNPSFKLYRLQQIDNQLDKVRERLSEIEQLLATDEIVREAQQGSDTAKQAKVEAQLDLRRAEEEVKARQDKLKQNQDNLYGGKVTNPKELQDLQAEAEAFTRHLHEAEDAQLEVMATLEEKGSAVEIAEKALEEARAQRGIESQALGVEQNELQEEFCSLGIRIEKQRSMELTIPLYLPIRTCVKANMGWL